MSKQILDKVNGFLYDVKQNVRAILTKHDELKNILKNVMKNSFYYNGLKKELEFTDVKKYAKELAMLKVLLMKDWIEFDTTEREKLKEIIEKTDDIQKFKIQMSYYTPVVIIKYEKNEIALYSKFTHDVHPWNLTEIVKLYRKELKKLNKIINEILMEEFSFSD